MSFQHRKPTQVYDASRDMAVWISSRVVYEVGPKTCALILYLQSKPYLSGKHGRSENVGCSELQCLLHADCEVDQTPIPMARLR